MFGLIRTVDRWFHRIDRCKQEYGLVTGLRVAAAIERLDRHPGPRAVIPATPPFLLRPRTTDRWTLDAVFNGGYYAHRGQPGLIIDAGAHIGCATMFFARRFPQARILALEPSADSFELLRFNAGAYPNVTTLRGALWGESGVIGVVGHANPTLISTGPEGREQVTAYTVPDLIRMLNAVRIDLLKIDIEGGERSVFSGDTSWLGSVGTIMIETHDSRFPDCTRTLFTALAPYDYRLLEVRTETLVIDIGPARPAKPS